MDFGSTESFASLAVSENTSELNSQALLYGDYKQEEIEKRI